MHAPRLSGGPARGIGAGEPGEVPQGVGVVDRVGSDDAIDVRSLDDAFDRYLDLLAGAGVRDGGYFDDLVGNMARGRVGSDRGGDALAELLVE